MPTADPDPPTIPAQRAEDATSLTQRHARSGRQCDSCGDERLTEIAMTLTDGTSVQFVSCHHCESRLWRAADTGAPVDLTFDTVLAHTRKPR